MSNGYEISFNKSPGQTILSGDFNNEFTALDTAFHETSGHTHDGTPGEGGPIATVQSSNGYNKVNIDAGNNEIEFHVNVSSAAVEQVKIKDGVIEPTTDDDIDLGSTTKEFKDLYIDGIAYIDLVSAGDVLISGDTVSGSILPSSDDTYDLGSATYQYRNLYVDGTAYLDTVDIDGGSINGTTIGTSGPSTGVFSSLTISGNTSTAALYPTIDDTYDLGKATNEWKDLYIDGIAYIDTAQITAATITTTDINSGTIDNCTVGATTPSTGVFTTLTAGTVDINGGNIDATDIGLFTPAGGTFTSLDVTTSFLPTVDNTVDLGSATYEFKDLYIDGTAYLDAVTADTVAVGTTNPGAYKLYVNGLSFLSSNVVSDGVGYFKGNFNAGYGSNTTSQIAIGAQRAAEGVSKLILYGEAISGATYTGGGFVLNRDVGVNGVTSVIHRGTGTYAMHSYENSTIEIKTDVLSSNKGISITSSGVTMDGRLRVNDALPSYVPGFEVESGYFWIVNLGGTNYYVKLYE